MTQQRRSFSAEFKHEAADLVLKQNYSYIEASRSLGVGESALRRWVDQAQQEGQDVTPQSKALTPEQQKTQELEAQIARLEGKKIDIKTASALLISEDHESVDWLSKVFEINRSSYYTHRLRRRMSNGFGCAAGFSVLPAAVAFSR